MPSTLKVENTLWTLYKNWMENHCEYTDPNPQDSSTITSINAEILKILKPIINKAPEVVLTAFKFVVPNDDNVPQKIKTQADAFRFRSLLTLMTDSDALKDAITTSSKAANTQVKKDPKKAGNASKKKGKAGSSNAFSNISQAEAAITSAAHIKLC